MREALTAAREAIAGRYQSRTTDEVLALIDAALAQPEPQGEREAFEAWAIGTENSAIARQFDDDTWEFNPDVWSAWQQRGWQAARAQAPDPAPAGWRLLKNSTHVERSFPEDWPYENGWYICECSNCGRMFNGHKRRITCKVCSMLADEPEGEMK